MSLPTTCPNCGFCTLFLDVVGAPGGPEERCVVCDLRAENDLLRASREQLRAISQALATTTTACKADRSGS